MSELPLVSVVIPCLNRANYLVPTLNSSLAQDSENPWVRTGREAAQKFEVLARSADALQAVYALGCFLLPKPE